MEVVQFLGNPGIHQVSTIDSIKNDITNSDERKVVTVFFCQLIVKL